MRRGQEKRVSLVSYTPLSFFPITYRVFYLCLSCVLGYGWKRLDFDICLPFSSIITLASLGSLKS